MHSKFDIPKLQALLQDFYTLTHIKIVVFDDNFVEIAAYPKEPCDFCKLIRSDAHANELCNLSDMKACEYCRKTGESLIYQCHAGLTETVTPIKHDHIIIGYMMFGQILMSKEKESYWADILERCLNFDIDLEKLEEAYELNNFIGIEQVRSAAKILEACAGYLWLSKLVVLEDESQVKKLDAYINHHIHENITAQLLCDALDISKSHLYKLSLHYYGVGIAEYIRNKRIEWAKELLINEELSVNEVALKVGIVDYNYFSKVFKKSTGQSPSQYRKDKI